MPPFLLKIYNIKKQIFSTYFDLATVFLYTGIIELCKTDK